MYLACAHAHTCACTHSHTHTHTHMRAPPVPSTHTQVTLDQVHPKDPNQHAVCMRLDLTRTVQIVNRGHSLEGRATHAGYLVGTVTPNNCILSLAGTVQIVNRGRSLGCERADCFWSPFSSHIPVDVRHSTDVSVPLPPMRTPRALAQGTWLAHDSTWYLACTDLEPCCGVV